MKIVVPILVVIAMSVLTLYSQSPVPPLSSATLEAVKAANQELIEQQKKTLGQLDTVLETARQVKIFAKRS